MSEPSRKVFERIYRQATSFEELPWHTRELPELLLRVLAARDKPGAALDIGCGAGTHSLAMAGRGYRVLAVDFMPQAVAMTRRRAQQAGLDIAVVEADITTFAHPGPFDLMLDAGCLHSLSDALRPRYRQQILRWLAPGGDYILIHFGRRAWWDRWPVGPRRVPRRDIVALFGPELQEIEYDPTPALRMPWFMGRRALLGRYWFRRRG